MHVFSSCSSIIRKVLLQSSYVNLSRALSTEPSSTSSVKTKCNLVACKLESRSLIKVSGTDALTFLQGVITNDIHHLETKPAIYTLFLNHQGRILYDAILYSTEKTGETLVECATSVKPLLMKHLNIYRVRRKVDISDGNSERKQNVWVIFDSAHKYVASNYLVNNNNNTPHHIHNPTSIDFNKVSNRTIDQELCCRPQINHSSKRQELPLGGGIEGIGDPRLEELGWRVFLSSNNPSNPEDLPNDIQVVPESEYIALRYSLGVGEGVSDLPPANCFPLESNGDYLHGISFQKGCYIGQELTARTHHTGVVRKRLMPFTFCSSSVPPILSPQQQQLIGKEGKPVGKVRGIEKSHGLALSRIEDALHSPEIKLGEHLVLLGRPIWWPIELPKHLEHAEKK